MKAFVTGGTGFIGSHLVDSILEDETFEEVRCLIRSREKWLEDKPFTRIDGNLLDIAALKEGIKNTDIVFHLAGLVKTKSWEAFKQVNVEGTENIIRVARKNSVSRIVILSSLAAAGPSRSKPKTESDPMTPVSMYGKSKMRMEERVHEIHEGDTTITILRPSAVYGPRDEDIYPFFKMASRRLCPIIGNGISPKISLVYVDDVIDGIMRAAHMENPGVHTYFISDGNIYTWNHIRETIGNVLNKKTIPIYFRPHWVKKVATIVEKTSALFGKYPIFNRDKAKELVMEWTCSVDKAKEDLQFASSVTLEEGFRKTVHWYKLHHWL